MTAHHPSALDAPTPADLAELAAIFAAEQPEVIDAIDRDPLAGVDDDEWPDGAALPWERDPTPCTRRSRFDAGVSDERLALAREVLS